MARALVLLLIVVATAASAQAGAACYDAIALASKSMNRSNCYTTNTADLRKHATYPQCKGITLYGGSYDVAFCAPIMKNYFKCIMQASGLLKADGTFDGNVYKVKYLKNQCDADTQFQNAYAQCEAATMTYLNFTQLESCLLKATRPK